LIVSTERASSGIAVVHGMILVLLATLAIVATVVVATVVVVTPTPVAATTGTSETAVTVACCFCLENPLAREVLCGLALP
jgi:hypothetical protein